PIWRELRQKRGSVQAARGVGDGRRGTGRARRARLRGAWRRDGLDRPRPRIEHAELRIDEGIRSNLFDLQLRSVRLDEPRLRVRHRRRALVGQDMAGLDRALDLIGRKQRLRALRLVAGGDGALRGPGDLSVRRLDGDGLEARLPDGGLRRDLALLDRAGARGLLGTLLEERRVVERPDPDRGARRLVAIDVAAVREIGALEVRVDRARVREDLPELALRRGGARGLRGGELLGRVGRG